MLTGSVLDLPHDQQPDPDEFVKAAMAWHFDPETGSPFWLRRAADLDFDPRTDVKSLDDLALFPNIVNELRDVPFRDLIPRGYGPNPDVVGIFESGGTTGAPKRVAVLRDWWEKFSQLMTDRLDAAGFPRGANWLGISPVGPHIIGAIVERQARGRGGVPFSLDMDPRWVKKLVAKGDADGVTAYAEHIVDQAADVLRSQDVGVLMITPPMLERIARREEVADLVNSKVKAIIWGGTQMDEDTRHLLRTEVFPDVVIYGGYGSTMMLGCSYERLGHEDCVFDPLDPYVVFGVLDPATGEPVPYGARGQVVMSHISANMLVPNNLERDLATRIVPVAPGRSDGVADVRPMATFDDGEVIEGVY